MTLLHRRTEDDLIVKIVGTETLPAFQYRTSASSVRSCLLQADFESHILMRLKIIRMWIGLEHFLQILHSHFSAPNFSNMKATEG